MELTEKQKQAARGAWNKGTTGWPHMLYAAVEAVLAEQPSAAEQGQGSLMRPALSCAPYGCYCEPGRCMAPKIMGVQQPCRDPKKAAGLVRQAPAQPPAGDVVERMLALAVATGGMVPVAELEEERKKHKEQGKIACELFDEVKRLQGQLISMVSLDAVAQAIRAQYPSSDPMTVEYFIKHVRARLAKPAEQTDEQKVEAILINALKKLSTLGNGEHPGNSIGNEIAQKALTDAIRLREELKAGKHE